MAHDPVLVRMLAEKVGLKAWDSFIEACSSTAKVIFLLGGWRAGKSARAAFIVLCAIFFIWLRREGTHLIWLVGPDYEQARPEYFYIAQWCAVLGLQVDASAAQQGSLRMVIQWKGKPGVVEVVTKSATDPTSLGGVAPVIILMCEAGQISEEGRMWVDGRTAEKNAQVIIPGTFENDDGKAQFVWFEVEGAAALANPTERCVAFRLPTWENEFLYGDCRSMIADDPTLEAWCPDDQHGPLHSGLNHPMMRQLKERWADRPRDWAKRFGGEPQGVANPVYEWALQDEIDDISGNKYLISRSEVERRLGPFLWHHTAGGLDPGLVHPAGLVIASTNQHRDIWFRDARRLRSGNNADLYALKDAWDIQYGVRRRGMKPYLQWGGDPVGLRYTRPGEHITAMTGSVWAREERASIVNSYAIGSDNRQHLYFDADVHGVRELFGEAKTIHRKLKSNGEWGYNREGDDLMAAGENAVVILHSKIFSISNRQRLPAYRRREPVIARSAS